MEINKNNYEAYLLDLMEGNLSFADQQKLKDFLRLNPDCSIPSYLSEPWILDAGEVLFSDKETLKKEFPNSATLISESNFDLFSIARMEGDLTARQEEDHQRWVEAEEERNFEWNQWLHTRLATPSFTYKGKRALLRRTVTKSRIIWLSILSSAATLTLLITLLRLDSKADKIQLAGQSPEQLESVGGPQVSAGHEVPLALEKASSPLEKASLALEKAHAPELSEESSAGTDEPILFSIKKKTEDPVNSEPKGRKSASEAKQDSMVLLKPDPAKTQAQRLAAYKPIQYRTAEAGVYDQIRPLDIPPFEASITHLSLAQIGEIELQEAVLAYKEEKDLSFWSIANAGINGINKITGADMSLLAARDESGGLSGFRFKSKRFSVSSPIERSERSE